jgi:hypothetical protein
MYFMAKPGPECRATFMGSQEKRAGIVLRTLFARTVTLNFSFNPLLLRYPMDTVQLLKKGFEAVLNTEAKERASPDYRKAPTITSHDA